MIDRSSVLAKLKDYLEAKTPKNEIYEWALATALSKEYEKIAQEDTLIQRTILALLDINHVNQKKIPLREVFEYYRRCLEGEEEFAVENIPMQLTADAGGLGILWLWLKDISQTPKGILVVLRIYVIIFGLSSVTIHLDSIRNPVFLRTGDIVPTQNEVFQQSLPHLIYAFLILLPPSLLARRMLFYFSFPFLTFGMLYYWYISFRFAIKLALNPIFVLVILPFTALPATLALVSLFMYREKSKTLFAQETFFNVEKLK